MDGLRSDMQKSSQFYQKFKDLVGYREKKPLYPFANVPRKSLYGAPDDGFSITADNFNRKAHTALMR